MKRILMLMLAASICLVTGCGSGPSSNRYVGSGEQTTAETELSTTADTTEEETITEETDAPAADPAETSTSNVETPESDTTTTAADKTATEELAKKNEEEAAGTKKSDASDAKPSAAKSTQAKAAQKNNESTNKAAVGSILNKASDKPAETKSAAVDLAGPIEQIRDSVKTLKTAVESEDTAKIAELASQITATWAKIKDSANNAYPDTADFVQEKIDRLSELTSAETLDYKALLQLDYELYQAMRQLADQAGV
ncbi:hypothetical protein PCCS19_05320 [Paenibacillus sp. CCS19]|uniref:hypothetical protein n=1 Tax=Paenibacillus sp. CCS19 TaxID=3158387 RepID=UPI00256999F9|nr:hypothetical protein [Paenibacillus cellulosilyticus]GMK37478.1 hypothetical protein PCCS19_05320 [Paenibacillus cellulosilyticus]